MPLSGLLTNNLKERSVLRSSQASPAPVKADADPITISGPPHEVRGRVTDEKGEPVAGATVSVKGTSQGTSTDENGEFVLKDVSDNAVVAVSHIQYEPQIVMVKGQQSLIVKLLQAKGSELDEVVINKGYYTEKQKLTTGNVSTIKSIDMKCSRLVIRFWHLKGECGMLAIITLEYKRIFLTVKYQCKQYKDKIV